MSYAADTDLQRRIGSSIYTEIYAQTVNNVSTVDTQSVAADLEAAAAEIDGAVSARYVLPVSGARSLALLKDWNLTLAEERAFARPAGADFTEKVKSRVAQVRQYLEKVRDGTFRLPDATEISGGSGAAFTQISPPVFERSKMTGF